MREAYTQLQLPEIYSKEGEKIQLKKGISKFYLI